MGNALTLGSSISSGDQWDFNTGAEKEIRNLEAKKRELEKQIKNRIASLENIHGPTVVPFLDTPTQDYDDMLNQLAKLNPDLYAESKKIDTTRDQIDLIDNDRINLQKALSDMKLANKQQVAAINNAAETGLQSVAQQKDTQLWAAQGIAGNMWATTGMLSKAAADITNKFAPTSASIEQQRQQWLGTAAWQAMAIPGQMSAIQAQNITNEAQRNAINNSNSSSSYASSSVPKIDDNIPPEEIVDDENNPPNLIDSFKDSEIERDPKTKEVETRTMSNKNKRMLTAIALFMNPVTLPAAPFVAASTAFVNNDSAAAKRAKIQQ